MLDLEKKEEKVPQQSQEAGCFGCLGCLIPILVVVFIIHSWWTSHSNAEAQSVKKTNEQKTHAVHQTTSQKKEKKVKTKPAPASTPTPPVQPSNAEQLPLFGNTPKAIQLPSFGDKVQVGNLIYHITSLRLAKTVGHKTGLDQTAKGNYYILGFTVELEDTSPSKNTFIDNNMFKLEVGNHEYLPDDEATGSVNSDDSITDRNHNYSGVLGDPIEYEPLVGEIAFDLPSNSPVGNLQVKVSGSFDNRDSDYNKTALIQVYQNK